MRVYKPYPAKAGAIIAVLALVLVVPLLLVGVGLGRTVWGGITLQYSLTPSELIIHYGPTQAVINRESVRKLEVLTPTEGVRLGGTAVPGLYDGHWRFAETGYIDLFATDTRIVVISVEGSESKWGISPADPDAFVAAFNAGGTGTFSPVPSHGWLYVLLIWAGSLLLIGSVGWLLLAIGRGSQRMAYAIDEEAVTIRLWWMRVRIPLAAIADVRLESPAGHPWRIWGADMGGFYWGDFRWKQAGGRIRLYATRIRPIVLINTPTRTYGITPEADEAFVAELQQRIGPR